mmetsp:Transcript_7582/g.27812  ORF Transcript_7582/g.27812 Transcript_7582/m.27812 type:complete len:283 (+) Transcript_7582:115-963(+)
MARFRGAVGEAGAATLFAAALCGGAGATSALTFLAGRQLAPTGAPSLEVDAAARTTAARGLRGGAASPSSAAGAAACLSLGAGATVAAAAVGRRSRRPRVAARAFEEELGVQAPMGYWDPLGFSNDGDFDEFYRRRSAELKNGRVAMYATMGYILPEYWRVPGFCSPSHDLLFTDIPNGLKAVGVVPAEGWLQILAWCGFFEVVINQPQHPTEPGNYYKGRLAAPGFYLSRIKEPEVRARSLNAELANGRLAMVAIVGMWVQDGLTGSAWGDWSLFTNSPLR